MTPLEICWISYDYFLCTIHRKWLTNNYHCITSMLKKTEKCDESQLWVLFQSVFVDVEIWDNDILEKSLHLLVLKILSFRLTLVLFLFFSFLFFISLSTHRPHSLKTSDNTCIKTQIKLKFPLLSAKTSHPWTVKANWGTCGYTKRHLRADCCC